MVPVYICQNYICLDPFAISAEETPEMIISRIRPQREQGPSGESSNRTAMLRLRKMAPKYYDIAVNLTDSMFHGKYDAKTYHVPDWKLVLDRGAHFGVDRVMLTGSSLEESRHCIRLAQEYSGPVKLCSTVGVHPCTVLEFQSDPQKHLEDLRQVVREGLDLGICKAIGEVGLDYDRLHYTPADVQREFFELQLKMACEFKLPLFLHMRAACDDFIEIIRPFIEGTRSDGLKLKDPRGVVHSFTGTAQEARALIGLGFYIGVNGCSLKTQENLEVVRELPLERIMIETDAPWCEIRKSHASYDLLSDTPNEFYPKLSGLVQQQPKSKRDPVVKLDPFLRLPVVKREKLDATAKSYGELEEPWSLGCLVKSRNEPCLVGQVAEIIAKLKDIPSDVVIETVYANSCALFS